jgi:diguanylate cyclase (GGDEF)-like protein
VGGLPKWWLAACLWAGGVLLAGWPQQGVAADGETAELWRLIDPHPNRAVLDAERQLAAAERNGDDAGQLRAWRILALAHNELLDMAALRRDVERGEPLAQRLGNIDAQVQFIAARGALERNAAHYAESAAIYDQAIALAEQHRLEQTLAGLHVEKAMGPLEQGRQSDALALLMKAYTFYDAKQDRLGIAQVLDAMGVAVNMAKAQPDDIRRAIDNHRRALELLDAKQNAATLLTVHYNLGMAYYYAKDLANARIHLERGLASSREIEGAVGTAYYDYQLARVDQDEKRYAAALAHLDRALPVFRQRGDIPLMVLAVTQTRADLLSLLGRVAEAMEALESARALLPRVADAPSRVARFHEIAAGIYARHGLYEKAWRALVDFGAAERRRVDAENSEVAAELKARFELKQKDSENALLRAQQEQASSRRMVLFLALALCLVVLGALAAYLAQQVRRSRRFATLAMRDELTGLPNRRSIVEYARLQWSARAAHEGKLRVALLDVDHFKSINDDFGHDVGDAVLAAFAQACAGRLRSSERLGRYGGEEFLLIMPGSDGAQVAFVFQRLQQAVRKLAVPGLPASRRITFSMGAAEAAGEQDTLCELIRRADEALYAAKQNGRDRCEVAAHVRLVGPSREPPLRQSRP